jgi:hypothetical protein
MGVTTAAKFEHTKEALTLLNILEDYMEDMEGREVTFIEGLHDRFDKYGDETFVSERQINWLRAIEGKYA